jgi:DNA polymerase phi
MGVAMSRSSNKDKLVKESRYPTSSIMTSNVLPLFWNLSSATKSTRLDASEQLITSLEKFQVDYLSANGKGDDADANVDGADEEDDEDDQDDDESGVEVSDDDDDDEDEDMETGRTRRHPDDDEDNAEDAARIRRMDKQFDANNSEDVKYSIKRLIRGLGSSRDSSRLGFAVALTEVSSWKSRSAPFLSSQLTYPTPHHTAQTSSYPAYQPSHHPLAQSHHPTSSPSSSGHPQPPPA